jgi:hypothetical protein
MGLLSTNITKVKRLSLRGVKLSDPQKKEEPTTIESPPTEEQIAYSKLIALNPLIEALVDRLDLITLRVKTGETPEPLIDNAKLIAIAKKILEPEESYTKEEIVARLQQETKVNEERAGKGFSLMLQAGAIEPASPELYYLGGSTPF